MNINMVMYTFNELIDNPELIIYAENMIEVFADDKLTSMRLLDVKNKQCSVGDNFNIEIYDIFHQLYKLNKFLIYLQ